MGIEKMREFRLGSLFAFSWIEQEALMRDHKGCEVEIEHRVFFFFLIKGKARWQDG
jgi:hypothetical protein